MSSSAPHNSSELEPATRDKRHNQRPETGSFPAMADEALEAHHARKVRAMLKANDLLQEKIKVLKREGKENYRVKQ